MITIMHHGPSGLISQGDPATLPGLLSAGTIFWLDLEHPTPDEAALLKDVFCFHPLAIEDAERPHQRPKVDEYDGYFFLTADEVTYAADAPTAANCIGSRQIASFLGATYLVTVNSSGAATIASLRDRCVKHPQIYERGMDFVLYTLLDELVDRYFPVLDTLDGEMDELETRIVESPDSAALGEILDTRRRLTLLRKLSGPLREVVQTLTTRNFPHIQNDTIPYLRDVSDHLFRISETLDTSRDLVSNTLDAYLSQVNNQMSRVMQRLTSFSTVFMPLSFITGVFGMNFTHQPWVNTSVWGWLAGMAVIGSAMAVWFRRHRWV